MATWRASARPSASSRRTWGLPPAASSDTLLGELKQWSKAWTRSLTRLPRCCQAPLERLAIQLARVGAEDLAAEPLDRLDLDPLGAAQPAGRLDRAHVTLERLGAGQFLQLLDALVVGAGLERLQQRPGGQLGARVGAKQRRAALLARWPGRGPGTSPAPARGWRPRPGRPRRRRCPRTGLVTLRGRRSTLRGCGRSGPASSSPGPP